MELSTKIVKGILANDGGKLVENLLLSPLSINTLLSIVASGLKPGPTLDKLLSLLGFKTVDDVHAKATDHDLVMALFGSSVEEDEGPLLSYRNGAWVDKKYSINPSFQQILETVYNSESSTLDFENKTTEAIKEINTWVEKATKGLIGKLPNVSEDTALIIANTLYFKAIWDNPFDPSSTRSDIFHSLEGDIIKVPYMCNYRDHYSYASSNEFKVLRLPYQNYRKNNHKSSKGKFAMYIVLPDSKDGILKLLDQFISNPDLLDLPFEFESLEIRRLRIPKFEFKYSFQVSEIMKQLGLEMNLKLDTEMLEGLNGDYRKHYIKIMHITAIVVNEYGTEAAAVTEFGNLSSSRYSPPPLDFIADHPFLFMIREDTSGTLIFFGVVVNPLDRG